MPRLLASPGHEVCIVHHLPACRRRTPAAFLTVMFRVNTEAYRLVAVRSRQLLVPVFTHQQTSSLTQESIRACLGFFSPRILSLFAQNKYLKQKKPTKLNKSAASVIGQEGFQQQVLPASLDRWPWERPWRQHQTRLQTSEETRLENSC